MVGSPSPLPLPLPLSHPARVERSQILPDTLLPGVAGRALSSWRGGSAGAQWSRRTFRARFVGHLDGCGRVGHFW